MTSSCTSSSSDEIAFGCFCLVTPLDQGRIVLLFLRRLIAVRAFPGSAHCIFIVIYNRSVRSRAYAASRSHIPILLNCARKRDGHFFARFCQIVTRGETMGQFPRPLQSHRRRSTPHCLQSNF